MLLKCLITNLMSACPIVLNNKDMFLKPINFNPSTKIRPHVGIVRFSMILV